MTIVWVSSYPRSGNTFLRIVMHRLYGVRTSVIYDVDGVAERLGPALIGFEERPGTLAAMRDSPVPHFVKTHRQRDAEVSEADRAICLVRDGRDAIVSWGHYESERTGRDFRAEVRRAIERRKPLGTGSWGRTVLSWVRPVASHRVLLRYEDLIVDPVGSVGRVLPGLSPLPGASVPSFAELHGVDPGFFRRGLIATHRTELPEDLHRLFWADPDNALAMSLLGYEPGVSSSA